MANAYELLTGLALLCESQTHQITAWKGVIANVGPNQVLIDQPAVDEMLTISEATRVLDERKWLTGLMNYGGSLLPLIELKTLIDPKQLPGKIIDRQVIILIEKYGPVGLLVDSVKGMTHYWSDDNAITASASSLPQFMENQIQANNTNIQVLDLKKLMSVINLNMVID